MSGSFAPHTKSASVGRGMVDIDLAGEADRADRARVAAGRLAHALGARHAQRIRDARQLLGLDRVELVIAAQHQRDDRRPRRLPPARFSPCARRRLSGTRLSSAMVCAFGVLTLVRLCVAGGRGVAAASVAAVSMFEA